MRFQNGDVALNIIRLEKQQRCITVRETGVSQHHGVPIEDFPETPRSSQNYRIEGFMEYP